MLSSEVLDLSVDDRPCVATRPPIQMESCVITNGCDGAVASRLPRLIQGGRVALPGNVCLPECLQSCVEGFNNAVMMPRHAAMGVTGLALWWGLAEAGFTPRPPTATVAPSSWAAGSNPDDIPTHTVFANAVSSTTAAHRPWSFRMAYNDTEAVRDFRGVSMSGVEVRVALTAHGVPPPPSTSDTRWVRVPSVRDVLAPATETSRLASLVASITMSGKATATPRWLAPGSEATIVTPEAFDAVAVVYAAVDVGTDELRVVSAPDLGTWHYWGDDGRPETDPDTRIRMHYPWVDAFIVSVDEYISKCGLQDWVRVVGTPNGAAIDIRELPQGGVRSYARRPRGPGIDNPLVVSSIEVAELGVALAERGVRVGDDGAPSILLSDLIFSCARVSFPILTRDPVPRSPRGVLSMIGHHMPQCDGEWTLDREGAFFPTLFQAPARRLGPRSSAIPIVQPWDNTTPVCIERVVRALATRYPKTVGKTLRRLKDEEREQFGDEGTGISPQMAFDTVNASQRAAGLPEFTRKQGAALAFYVFPASDLSSCGCGTEPSTCRLVTIQPPPKPSAVVGRRRRATATAATSNTAGTMMMMTPTTTAKEASFATGSTLSLSDQVLLKADTGHWADALLTSSGSEPDDDDDDDDDSSDEERAKFEAEVRSNHKICEYFPIKASAAALPVTKKRTPPASSPLDDDDVAVCVKTTVATTPSLWRPTKRVRVRGCV